jgi:hypothetical protein
MLFGRVLIPLLDVIEAADEKYENSCTIACPRSRQHRRWTDYAVLKELPAECLCSARQQFSSSAVCD